MFSIKVEPEDSSNWDEECGSTIIPRIKQERIEEDVESDEVTLQVTVHMDDDEGLAENSENVIVAAVQKDSNQEDEGCELSCSQPLSHEVHPSNGLISLAGNSSLHNTYSCAYPCEVITNEDLYRHTNSSSVLSNHLPCGEVSEKSFCQKQHLGEDGTLAQTGDTPLKCKLCDKSIIHKVCQGHGINQTIEKPFQCQFCGKAFNRKHDCKRHEMVHTGEKPFNCQFCEKSFSQKAKRRIHEMTHTGEKPFKCQFCEMPFTHRNSWKTHEMIHTGEKPYPCQFCEKSFTKKSDCTTHEMIHTGEKPFKCQFCVKAFSKKYKRLRHEMTHTGDKPFKCRFCERSFTWKWDCKKHEKIHIEERTYESQVCENSFYGNFDVNFMNRLMILSNPSSVSFVGSSVASNLNVSEME